MALIRVWAPEGAPPVPYRNTDGAIVRGRFIARGSDGKPLPEGEEVHESSQLLRDIRRGELTNKAPSQKPANKLEAKE